MAGKRLAAGADRPEVRYQHARPVEPGAAAELSKALSFYYGRATVIPAGESIICSVAAELSEPELGAVVRHFLRGHHETAVQVIAEHPATGAPSRAVRVDDRIELAPGNYLQGPAWTGVMDQVRRLVLNGPLGQFGAPLLTTPAQIARDVLVRAGYYRKFPNLVNALGRIRANYWDGVAVAQLHASQQAALSSFYEASDTVLNPVTCYHVYANAIALRQRYGTDLFAVQGPVFRHEAHNHDATRLAEFTMIELVRLGSAEQVRGQFDQLIEAMITFFDQLTLPYRIVSAADAFFGEEPALTRSAQLANASKFEVRVPLDGGELSVASVNLHGGVFVEAFELGEVPGWAASCCAGIGLERLAYALDHYRLLPEFTPLGSADPGPSTTEGRTR